MTQAAVLTICPMGRYLSPMSKGRKPVGPRGPYPNRILVLRTGRFTQALLGERVGVGGPYIGRLEKGEISLSDDMLQKLCVALDCRPWEVDPIRFQLTEADVQALTINRLLSENDPERRERWIGAGEDALKAVGKL